MTDVDTIKKRHEKFIEAYKRLAGNISACCRELGISRNCYYEWLKKDADFAAAIKDAELYCIDIAESSLMKQVMNGNMTAIIFYLTNRSRDRWQHVKHIEGNFSHKVESVLGAIAKANNGKSRITELSGEN